MARCKNCGYIDNPDGAVVCAGCGQPLLSESFGPSVGGGASPRPTVADVAVPRPTRLGVAGANQPEPRPTVVLGAPQVAVQHPIAEQSVTARNTMVQSAYQPANTMPDLPTEQECDECHQMVSLDNRFCPHCGTPIRPKTVRFSIGTHKVDPKPQPRFSLTLIPEEGEVVEQTVNNYEGESVVLNRANTEATNRTITSREQAVVSFTDGHWVIENRSDYESTFVRVTRPMQLQSGDIVALGDRKFRFATEEPGVSQ